MKKLTLQGEIHMNNIKKNIFYNTAYKILLVVIPIITTPYVSRTLGASGIGTYSYAFTIANYFCIFIKLGLDDYGSRAVAESKDNIDDLEKTFSSICYFQWSLGIIVSVCYIGYTFFVSDDLKLALVFTLTVVASCFDISWFLSGMELFKAIAIRSLAVKILNTICIFFFVKKSSDTVLYCFILAFGMLLNQLCVWPVALHIIRLRKVSWNLIIAHLKPNFLLFISVISVTLYKSIDKLMLGYYDLTKMHLGFYESAEKIINIPILLVVSVGSVMMPRITNMISNGKSEYKNYVIISEFYSLLVVSAVAFGIMAVSQEFVPIFFGPGFDECIPIFLILLPSCIFIAVANIIRNQYLLPNHMDTQFIISELVGMIVNLILNFLLIPKLWAVGAAIGTTVAEFVSCFVQVLAVRKAFDLKSNLKICFIPVVTGIVMFIIIYPIQIAGMGVGLTLLGIKIVIGGVFYVLVSLIDLYLIGKMKKPSARIVYDSFGKFVRIEKRMTH